MNSTDLVLTFTTADIWDDARRREYAMPVDRLLVTCLGHSRIGGVLVADPYRSGPVRLARRALADGPQRFPQRPGCAAHVAPLRFRRTHPRSAPAIARLYVHYDRRLKAAATELGLERPAVITGNPFVAAFCPLEWAGRVVYFGWDDWAAFGPHEPWWGAYSDAYRRIAASGRAVCAVSQTIIDRIAPLGESAVMPNGLSPDEWVTPGDPPPWFASLPRPRLLYVGSIGDRLDIPAVLDLSARHPEGAVVLVGNAGGEEVTPLRDVPNIHLPGSLGRREVPGLVYAADVGIIPHRTTRLTQAMSPMKLYEFLGGGCPVAATDLPPMRGVDRRVLLCPPGERFADTVRRALATGRATEAERLGFVRANTWARRHEVILDLALGAVWTT